MRLKQAWQYRRILWNRRFGAALWRARKNIMTVWQGGPPPYGPFMAELDITYRCNCRCRMCQRWRDPRRGELTLTEYDRLALHFHNLGVHQISIAGGEPLLRRDVFEIIHCFSDRGMSVNLCTNGLLLEKTTDDLCASGATTVTVSLDGASPGCHDWVRGKEEGYRRIEAGLFGLSARPFRDRPVLRVRMTFSNRNVNELRPFYRRWNKVVDDVLFQSVHQCEDAFYTGLSPEDTGIDPDRLSRQINGTPLEKDHYMGRLTQSLDRDGGLPRQTCYAGTLMTRIDPWGNVFPCLEQHVCTGSLRDTDFDRIWRSDPYNTERRRLMNHRPCVCWYNNTAMIGHWGRILKKTGNLVLRGHRAERLFRLGEGCS